MAHSNNPRTFATPGSPIVQRASQELRNDYRKNFARGGTVHFEHFPSFTVRYPYIEPSHYPARLVEFVAGNLTDKYAKDTLENDFRCLNWLRECTHLVPLYTTGDGNCLLHAASLAMWGFEDKEFILRNALYESLTTAERGTNTLQDRCRMSIFSMLRDVQVNMSDNDWYLEWQQIVNQAKPNMSGHHQSLEESHIFVLANILRRPIIVYGVPKVRSFNTGGTMQNINFHGVYLPLLWGSQLCHKPPLCLGYGMGHFTALVPSGNRQQQLVVPLTDNIGHVLPIRFLLQAEEQNTFYLLEQYLDVIQQYSSSLGKQIPVAVIALREAPHMQHLVQAYIDMSLTMFNEQNHIYYTQSQPSVTSQGESPRNPCVGCDTGAFGSAETNFLCSVCYKNQTSAVAVAGYNPSQGLKCRSPGCQQQGQPSKDGYCNGCSAKANNPSDERQWNNLDTGKGGSPHAAHFQNPPAAVPTTEPGEKKKCHKCKEFYANEEYGGLCSGCFKKLTIAESQQKPFQQQHVQPSAVQVNNNAEAAADKCNVCKEFHGYAEFGGLCSVCFKNKSKEESTAKPPQQQLNNFRQDPTPYQAQQGPPAHQQQPVHNQGQTNPPPPANSQPQPNPFGFSQCMSQGCARPADEHSRGYCTQCFANSVTRYQKSQQDQQRVMGQQGQQQWQQDEQIRREQELRQQQAEKERMEQLRREQDLRDQEIKRQQAEKERMEQETIRREQEIRRLEQERSNQHETIKQQPVINETRGSGFVPQPRQRQFQQTQLQETPVVPQQPRHAMTAPVSTGILCKNVDCGDCAAENCDGYCSKCYLGNSQRADVTAQSHDHSPKSTSAQQPPPIKPRTKVTRLISEKSADEGVETLSVGGRSNSVAAVETLSVGGRSNSVATVETLSVGGRSNSVATGTLAEIKCFMCAKVKPNTGDLSYSLCPAHAQQVALSLGFDTPPASQQPEASYSNQQSSYQVHETTGDQQRRGSANNLQVTGLNRHSAEQKVTHHSREHQGQMDRYSGEQHQAGGSRNSGEQLNRGPQPSPHNQPPQQHQMNISTHHHTGEQTSRSQHDWSQERSHTTELPFGGPQSRYPPNSKNYGRPSTGGQTSYQQEGLPMGSQTNSQGNYDYRSPPTGGQTYYQQGDLPMGSQTASQDDYSQRTINMQDEFSPRRYQQDDINQKSRERSFSQPGQNASYNDHQWVASNRSDIKYPPGYNDRRDDNPPRDHQQNANNQFYNQPPNQFSGSGGAGYPMGHNDQFPQSYQQQQPSQNYPHQQNYGQQQQNYGQQQQNYRQQQQNYGQQQQNYGQQQQNYDQRHPGGAGNYIGANQQQYPQQQYDHRQQQQQQSGGGNQGFGGASNYGPSGAASNYPPQAGGYREGAGGGPPQKPPISSHADPNATHPYNDDMPRTKVLCKYPGCSFYADPKLDNYCQDCFDNKDKTGLKNYKRCQTPTCSKHVPKANASNFCDSCLVSTANKH